MSDFETAMRRIITCDDAKGQSVVILETNELEGE